MALSGRTKAVLLVSFWICVTYSADFKVSECFDAAEPTTQGTVTLTCPENYVISVDDAFFGSNLWGACIITKDDCIEQTKIFQVCDGQVNCTRTFKTFTTTCGFSTRLELGYSCIRSYKDHSTISPIDAPDDSDDIFEVSPSDDVARPQVFPTSNPKTPGTPPGAKSNSKDNEELGLIIGCAIASFITVVFLIIAIVMVIRRLIQSDEKDRRDNGTRTSTTASNCGSVCIKLDCLPCISRTETPRKNSHDLRMRKKSAIETGPQSDQSKLRVAPIGEESIADQGSTLSEGQDSNSSESSKDAEDLKSLQPSPRLGKTNPEKPARQKQQREQERHSQQDTFLQEGKHKKEKLGEISSNKDNENKNTLPSSSNRNLQLLQDDISYPTQTKHISNPSQHACSFDAIAIPNTMARSTC